MSHINERWLEQQRSRWLRPDYERYLRPDRARYEKPGASQQTAAPDSRWLPLAHAEHEQKAFREEQVSLADLRRERRWLAQQRLELLELYDLRLRLKALNPSQRSDHYLYQSRVPKGNPDGGEWTKEGNALQEYDSRLASNEEPRGGRLSRLLVLGKAADKLIRILRSEDGILENEGTYSLTHYKGEDIFGPSSKMPSYTSEDLSAAKELRERLITRHPNIMRADNLGRMPNNVVFHAETTALLRAARRNGGTLRGENLDIYVDRPMCNNCDAILPLVSGELGNPTVTFLTRKGTKIKVLRDGKWEKE